MFRSANHVASGATQRAREEIGEAWAHLLAAAEHGARQAGVATRRQSAIARDRAAAAALALRGEQPPSPWRWLAVGLAAGVAIGSAGAVILSRRMKEVDAEAIRQRATAAAEAMRERAGETIGVVRERTGEATQNAVSTARHTAGRVTGRLGGPASPPGEPSTDTGPGAADRE
jgi:hypothetical protein